MYKHLITLFLQNNFRKYFISTINFVGLTLGLLSTFFILEYVLYQRSYESYNENASDLYRIAYKRFQNGKEQWNTAHSYFPTGSYLKEHFHEVEDYSTFSNFYNITVSCANRDNNMVAYNEEKTFFTNSSVFKLFSIQIKSGKYDCLDAPYTVAISQRAANKYFGEEDPIGKIISVNYTENYTITAVYKTIPWNTHLKSDFFFSIQTLLAKQPGLRNGWANDIFYNYIMLKPGTDYEAFAFKAFPAMIKNSYANILKSMSSSDSFYLQPIGDIHLQSNIENELDKPVNGKMVSILFGFSIFFLIVAWINYINMITASALERAREIGIKKVNGAKKLTLIMQFVGEAFLLNAFCLTVALLFFYLINPFFILFAEIQPFTLKNNTVYIFVAISIFLLGILMSSIYPAFVISAYKPIEVLKGIFKDSPNGIFFRKSLLTFQFIISIILLITTFAANKQIQFLEKKDIGINYYSTLIIRSPKMGDLAKEYMNRLTVLKDSIGQIPSVEQLSIVSDIPGQEIDSYFSGFRKGPPHEDFQSYYLISTDNKFIDFFNIKLLAGKGFEKEELPEQNNIIMNLSAIKRFGFDDPAKAVGQILVTFNNREHKVIGVTPDFNYYSKKVAAMPTVINLSNTSSNYILIKISSSGKNDYGFIVKQVEQQFKRVFPNRPFEYHFLEDSFKKDLKSDKIFITIFGTFSALAIMISAIGILGLLMIIINQNMKTLAIRKALGAKIGNLIIIISHPVIMPFIIALIIALPLSYYGIKKWLLSNYLHQLGVSFELFLLPIICMTIVIISIIILLALKVKNMRIAEVLQYE